MATFSAQVAAGGDDGNRTGTSTFTTTATTWVFGNSGGFGQNAFARYDGVTITNGASVSAATVTGRCTSTLSGTTVNATLGLEDADDPSPPSDATDFDARTLASAASWNSIGSQTSGSDYTTADFASSAQAVFARGGWASGQAVQFFIRNNASTSGARRQWASSDHSTAPPPQIDITYTVSTGSPWHYYAQAG